VARDFPKHVLSAEQFDPDNLAFLFEQADYLDAADTYQGLRRKNAQRHVGRRLTSLFYQPSTRTRISFETAAVAWGMGLVSTENAKEFSSAAKGETLEDSVRVINGYRPDIIVMRHDEVGSAARSAAVSEASIINGGDGGGEHPTQALLDSYTIFKELGRLSNLNVVMGGDLRYGRTVRSLAKILSLYENNHIEFVSVPGLFPNEDITNSLEQAGVSYGITEDMNAAFKGANAVYWTRLQKEYITDPSSIPEGGLVIDQDSLEFMEEDTIILHPLPRVGEITSDVDKDPRAKYFKQAGNGLYVRMALINCLLDGSNVIPLHRRLRKSKLTPNNSTVIGETGDYAEAA